MGKLVPVADQLAVVRTPGMEGRWLASVCVHDPSRAWVQIAKLMLVSQAALVDACSGTHRTVRGPDSVVGEEVENQFQVDHRRNNGGLEWAFTSASAGYRERRAAGRPRSRNGGRPGHRRGRGGGPRPC